MKNFRRSRRSRKQDGYFLLSILLAVTFLSLALMAAAPAVVQQIKRDREEEMIHRGAQYARAIKKFVRKFGRYPASLEQLENTNNIRFLRQRYKDPITGKDFRLLHYGDVQLTPGQGGIGGGQAGAPAPSGAFGSSPSQPGSSPSSFGSSAPTPQGSQSAFSGPAFSGSAVGGGAIIGVASTSEQQSIRVFGNKSHYNQWQFIYDPTTDRGALITGPYQPLQQLMPGAQGLPGTPGSQGPGMPPPMPK